MADKTHIEWADATWNPITGCSVVSPGCTNCYAMRLAGTRLKHLPSRAGLTQDSKAGPVWNGKVRFNKQGLDQPLRWWRPRRIFVCAHGDLFHPAIPDEWIDQAFAVMALAPQHVFIVLTKRGARMRYWFRRERGHTAPAECLAELYLDEHPQIAERWPLDKERAIGVGLRGWPLPNVWLGVSVEDHERADERIPDLLATPAAVRFISAEPLLGPLDLGSYLLSVRGKHDQRVRLPMLDSEEGRAPRQGYLGEAIGLDWVIAGGESGPNARPMHPDWARSLRDQCIAARVPFFFKQWGEWLAGENLGWPLARWQDGQEGKHDSPDHIEWRHFTTPGEYGAFTIRVGKRAAGRLLDGHEWSEFPG